MSELKYCVFCFEQDCFLLVLPDIEVFFFRCDHDKRKSAVDCITEIIGENNAEHFFVATQDADMRNGLQEVCAFFRLSNKMHTDDFTCRWYPMNLIIESCDFYFLCKWIDVIV